MIFLFLLKIITAFAFCSGSIANIPTWIRDNPGYENPIEIDSIKSGCGFICVKEKGSWGWKVFLNDKAGYGIEIELEVLKSNPDLDEFLMVSSWPLNEDFKQIQLFTGTFTNTSKKIRIPNTKTFFILFNTSPNSLSPEMAIKYRRYGTSLEVGPPPTDIPIKKETVYEVQLKGKSPNEFSNELLAKIKEGLRASARRYCNIHNIPFNETLTTKEMVVIHRISFCPFEWPERNICTSIEHSIFVSGVRTSVNDFILNYQLTANHLRNMWRDDFFQELKALGITVFHLPTTSYTVLNWSLIIGLMMISSLLGTFIFWKANYIIENSSRKNSTISYEVKKTKKPKLKLAKHQQVPSFMYKNPKDTQIESVIKEASEEVRLKAEIGSKPEQITLPNYFGSILFGINKGFEDEEESSTGLHNTSKNK